MVCKAGSGRSLGAISRSRNTSAATAGDTATPSASSQAAQMARDRAGQPSGLGLRTPESAGPDRFETVSTAPSMYRTGLSRVRMKRASAVYTVDWVALYHKLGLSLLCCPGAERSQNRRG